MAKKKKAQLKAEIQAVTLPKPAECKKCKYTDPCFHCAHLEMISTGMNCTKKSPAFWATFQGFKEHPETPSSAPGDVCDHFKDLKGK